MYKLLIIILYFLFTTTAFSDTDVSTVSAGSRSYSVIDKYWLINPAVFVCDDLRISRSRVDRAIRYWQRLGYSFESINYNYTGRECHGMPSTGSIVITIPDQNFDASKLALTRTAFNSETREIYHSTIQVPNFNTTKERVLEHEFGHAFGWTHSTRSYYIMNRNWKLGGWNSAGLSNDRYLRLIGELITANSNP